MNNTDRLVHDLIDALDVVRRVAESDTPGATAFIQGAAEQAIKHAHAQMVRNADGYLVVAEEVK